MAEEKKILKRSAKELRTLFIQSFLVDLIGNISYIVPFLGEFVDIFWAPIAATCIWNLYPDLPSSVVAVGFAEEILPFTDIIPTALICCGYIFYQHVIQYGWEESVGIALKSQ